MSTNPSNPPPAGSLDLTKFNASMADLQSAAGDEATRVEGVIKSLRDQVAALQAAVPATPGAASSVAGTGADLSAIQQAVDSAGDQLETVAGNLRAIEQAPLAAAGSSPAVGVAGNPPPVATNIPSGAPTTAGGTGTAPENPADITPPNTPTGNPSATEVGSPGPAPDSGQPAGGQTPSGT